MMNKMVFRLLMVLSVFSVKAQQNVFLTIKPIYNGQPLDMTQSYTHQGQNLLFDHFDYYLSGIKLIHDGGQVLDLENQVFLIEPTSFTIYLGFLNVTVIEQISAFVGVPPNLNTSSGTDAVDITQYPSNHPLSFQEPSMYWGWTSGYMHMIIGGNVDENADGSFETLFELHNLGDANYRGFSLPVIQTQTASDQVDIYLNCQVDQWVKDVSLSAAGVSHGTSGLNLEIMKNVETEPVFVQALTAGISHNPERRGEVKLTTNELSSTVTWSGMENIDQLELIDMSGKTVISTEVSWEKGNYTFDNPGRGIFFVRLLDQNQALIQSVKCMLR